MPLSERVRVEIYLPDVPRPQYQDLLEALEEELSRAFGGASIIRGVEGRYVSHKGDLVRDRVNLLYTDTGFSWSEDRSVVNRYTDRLRQAAFDALEEESILVVAYPVYHSQ